MSHPRRASERTGEMGIACIVVVKRSRARSQAISDSSEGRLESVVSRPAEEDRLRRERCDSPRVDLCAFKFRNDGEFLDESWPSSHSSIVQEGRRASIRMRCRRNSSQNEFAFRTWGGARRGAGRKSTGTPARASHRSRPPHAPGNPLHITIRLRAGLPSLRHEETRNSIARAFAGGGDRFGFRLDQFSLQSNHVHLIAEAEDRVSLSRGMQGLLVRVARALNRLWRRSGSVFADRFHARALRTPREVRAALVYVLQNARRHGLRVVGIDPYSSGYWFGGWRQELASAKDDPGSQPRTWLLRVGWRRHGPIELHESPSTGRPMTRGCITARTATGTCDRFRVREINPLARNARTDRPGIPSVASAFPGLARSAVDRGMP